MIGLSSLLAATLWQAAVPPPVEQQTADCARPMYAVDQLICADPTLRAVENQLAAAWRDARPLPVGDWLEDQSVWFRRRALCAFQTRARACVQAATRERMMVLAAARQAATVAGQPAVCSDGVSSRTVSLARLDRAWVATAQGQIAWAGAPATRDWRPFVVGAGRGSRLEFRRVDGAWLTCRLERRR
jgi:uncharacterized protein